MTKRAGATQQVKGPPGPGRRLTYRARADSVAAVRMKTSWQHPEKRLAAAARRRTLTEWRRVDLEEAEVARKNPARTASDLIPRVLVELKLEQRVAESQILKVWQQVIDPTLSAHAQPAGLFKGTLFVNVDSNVWLSEIVRYRRREILERLQHVVGKEMLQRISFRLG